MQLNKQIFEIIPFKSVGPFKLNNNVSTYANYNLTFHKENDSTGWDAYNLDDKISLYTDGELIVSIACRVACSLQGDLLVGEQFSQFLTVRQSYNISHDKIYMPEDDNYQDVYDIDEFGLQLWVRNDIIVTVFCSRE